jgi:predicted nucleic acid-binding Zn ribbon protein
MRRLILVLGGWLALVGSAVAQAPCPANFQGQTATLICSCSAEATRTGTVWGSGTYTSDSRICRAAVHAGAIPFSGGLVQVMPEPGLAAYEATEALGVTSAPYGPWGASFTISVPDSVAVRPSPEAACPANFLNRTAALTCTCSAEAAMSGAVWGSGTYTTDSRICRAAVHAGVIPASGGVVGVEPAPGQPSYASETHNGITTQAFGPWNASFTFGMPAMPAAADCPANFEGRTAPLSCICSASQTATGAVWGTGIYTSDSRVCRAARHAGAIGPEGGAVTVQPQAGQAQYFGSQANGVASSNFGPWGGSFNFQR